MYDVEIIGVKLKLRLSNLQLCETLMCYRGMLGDSESSSIVYLVPAGKPHITISVASVLQINNKANSTSDKLHTYFTTPLSFITTIAILLLTLSLCVSSNFRLI
jgi:hypothetical protein